MLQNLLPWLRRHPGVWMFTSGAALMGLPVWYALIVGHAWRQIRTGQWRLPPSIENPILSQGPWVSTREFGAAVAIFVAVGGCIILGSITAAVANRKLVQRDGRAAATGGD